MFARVTQFKMKPGTREAATERLNAIRDQVMELGGLKHFITVMNEDGSGYVVSVVESQAASDANADKVTAIWGNFAEFLEGVPTPGGYDVIADWSN